MTVLTPWAELASDRALSRHEAYNGIVQPVPVGRGVG